MCFFTQCFLNCTMTGTPDTAQGQVTAALKGTAKAHRASECPRWSQMTENNPLLVMETPPQTVLKPLETVAMSPPYQARVLVRGVVGGRPMVCPVLALSLICCRPQHFSLSSEAFQFSQLPMKVEPGFLARCLTEVSRCRHPGHAGAEAVSPWGGPVFWLDLAAGPGAWVPGCRLGCSVLSSHCT